MSTPARTRWFRRLLGPVSALVLAVAGAGALWLAGCAANDPFDPDSVPNARPVASMFATPVDSGGGLNPTSYYRRTFHWSGTDRDGWVTEYYVSVRTESDVPAPWDTTTRTDTTMSFVTDIAGEAEATFLLACRDDRGALSDTVVQFFPLKNSPPAVNFQVDFEPLSNMQRQVTGGAVPDTVYWNFGICNFRLFAFDLDGADTMDPFYRYTLADGDPELTWDQGDPAADPELGWVRVPFASPGDIKEFEIQLMGVAPGARTLTVSVTDEGFSDTRLLYSWEVREPAGPVLWVPDITPTAGRTFFREMLDATLGAGRWDSYEFLYGFPDRAWVLLESMRLFDAVIWSDGGTTSPTLKTAAARDGVLQQYVIPTGGQPAGRLMLVSRGITGNETGLSPAFIQTVLKLSPSAEPATPLRNFSGLQVLGDGSWLPPMACTSNFAQAIGLKTLAGSQWVCRFEECCDRGCFGSTRPVVPCDPIVVARWPLRATDPLARVVSAGLQPEYFVRGEAIATFGALLTVEMGVAAP